MAAGVRPCTCWALRSAPPAHRTHSPPGNTRTPCAPGTRQHAHAVSQPCQEADRSVMQLMTHEHWVGSSIEEECAATECFNVRRTLHQQLRRTQLTPEGRPVQGCPTRCVLRGGRRAVGKQCLYHGLVPLALTQQHPSCARISYPSGRPTHSRPNSQLLDSDARAASACFTPQHSTGMCLTAATCSAVSNSRLASPSSMSTTPSSSTARTVAMSPRRAASRRARPALAQRDRAPPRGDPRTTHSSRWVWSHADPHAGCAELLSSGGWFGRTTPHSSVLDSASCLGTDQPKPVPRAALQSLLGVRGRY
jgi:hypothetical protein